MTHNPHFDALKQRIATQTCKIGVMGLGYVGIPLALAAIRGGHAVVGFDTNPKTVATLNRGQTSIKHVDASEIASAIERRLFDATGDFSRLAEVDAILIAVPTPLTKHREPDLSFVEATGRNIARRLRPGQLIVLESTTWPGTTHELLRPILEESGLVCGRDFFLAYSPEREDPGNPKFGTATIPKVVGAEDALALELATILYEAMVVKVIPVSSSQTAEAVKLTENIFRAVNIALVNELKQVYARMGIDIWEVIDAAKTKPFGFMPFYPGPGLGGHCIPIDPFYLTWKAREYNFATRCIELAGEINTGMPRIVVDELRIALDAQTGRGLNGSKILIAGAAYKKNVDDMRQSPSLVLIELLEAAGANVDYHDPYVPVIPVMRDHPALLGRKSVAWTRESLRLYDAVLISTDHDDVDYRLLATDAKLVVDTRNVCHRFGVTGKHIVKA